MEERKKEEEYKKETNPKMEKNDEEKEVRSRPVFRTNSQGKRSCDYWLSGRRAKTGEALSGVRHPMTILGFILNISIINICIL